MKRNEIPYLEGSTRICMASPDGIPFAPVYAMSARARLRDAGRKGSPHVQGSIFVGGGECGNRKNGVRRRVREEDKKSARAEKMGGGCS